MMYSCLLLFGILLSGVKCSSKVFKKDPGGYYFVTIPDVLRFNSEQTTVVNVFGLTNAEVKIWLQLGEKKFSEQTVHVENEWTPSSANVKVTESDLFEYAIEEKPRVIKICSEWFGETQAREVMLSYETGYMIVQTDKPIYTPLEKVNVRTLALDESLRAVDDWHVGMEIISPSNLTMARRIVTSSPGGFFQRVVSLPPFPELGTWTVRAFYTGLLETESRTQFEVQEYAAPTFGVKVAVDVPYILQDYTQYILVTVRAKYTYGKPVDGNARLALSIIYQNGTKEYILGVGKQRLEHDETEGSVVDFTIYCADIMNSLSDGDFPTGSRLEILATVFESCTGKEEAAKHEETVFAIKPYIFKFTRSKLNFLPGLLFYLKVDMLYANGHPVIGERIKVTMVKSNEYFSKETITNSKGQAESIFLTSPDSDTISFFAGTTDDRYISEYFEVNAHVGGNRLQLEHAVREDTVLLQAFTNIQGTGFTGMFFVIVTRGRIVYTKFREAANLNVESLGEDLLAKMSPSARLLVFCVDKSSNELIVSSIKFDVEAKCQGEGLNLETTKTVVTPGTRTQLNITGSPFMWVGLSGLDKALFLHKSKNVLQQNKLFDLLGSHDLGCGDGSGSTSEEVFKKSGLTVLTNADISENDLAPYTDECETNRRRKRENRGDGGEVGSRGGRNIKRRSLEEASQFSLDLARLADAGIRPRTSSDFRQSWLFDVIQLDINGQTTQDIYFPDYITEWRIQALGVTPDNGICIADALDINSFKTFFVQLDLPYKVVRLESTEVNATIFNYGRYSNVTANVYLEEIENICYNGVSGMPTVQISMPPNSAKTVSFPIVPLRTGSYPIAITAIDAGPGIPEFRKVEKRLYVVNEGVEEKIAIHVCLDPFNQMDNCRNDDRVISNVISNGEGVYIIDLKLPKYSIPGTGAATAYMQSTLNTHVVETNIDGVLNLLRRANGDGESTVFTLAGTVYTMSYLTEEKQVTREIESKANQWIRGGVNRELSFFRHPDGSYAAWQHRQSSTWLTAFVVKVFCQANKLIDGVVGKEDLKPTIDWLINNVNQVGSFVELNPVLRKFNGQLSNPSLTAFVLITLLECDITSPDTVVCLQAISKYRKAISAASTASEGLFVELIARNYNEGLRILTDDHLGLLTIVRNLPVENGDNKLAVKVIGTGSGKMRIDLRYNRPATEQEVCPFVISDPEIEVIDIQFDADQLPRHCDVCGRCEEEPEVDYDYGDFTDFNSTLKRRKRYAEGKPKICMRFSVRSTNEEVHTMVVVKVGLETGVEVVKDDIEKLLESNTNIVEYEMPPGGKDFVLFYLNEVTSSETRFVFRVVDNFEGDSRYRQPSSVKVYDYYNPDQPCMRLYGTGSNQGPNFECNDAGANCRCIQDTCINSVEDEIRQLVRKRKRPAISLHRYTCNLEKANYAVRVEIESVSFDPDKNLIVAHGEILRSIHKGMENLQRGDSITFFWNARCDKPDLQEGKRYIIIGKDGMLKESQTKHEFWYPLTGTALVIRDESRRRDKMLYSTIQAYQMLMESGCRHY